jgi:hypothetical protein
MKLKVTLEDGSSDSYQITPKIEVEFEKHVQGGFVKTLRDEEKQEHVYYLAYLCLKNNGHTVKPFTDGFLDTLSLVELELDSPNG